jgi:hypothetical protein
MLPAPGYDPIPLDEYEPLLLSTQEHFNHYWSAIRPLLDKCVKRAMKGEMTVEDIHTLAMQKHLYIFIAKTDKTLTPSVKLVVVLEAVNYPRLAALNVMALGGSDLQYFYEKYWNKLCGWAYMNGVRMMESWVSPAMERVVARYKFKRAYTLMRFDLTEE